MRYRILYHPKVRDDVKSLDKKQKGTVERAIESRLGVEPEKYGKPLERTLKGYWKLRVGDIRIVFKIAKNEVHILGILHRKMVYESIIKRL
jgi:mRNA interferase RelE/StbE